MGQWTDAQAHLPLRTSLWRFLSLIWPMGSKGTMPSRPPCTAQEHISGMRAGRMPFTSPAHVTMGSTSAAQQASLHCTWSGLPTAGACDRVLVEPSFYASLYGELCWLLCMQTVLQGPGTTPVPGVQSAHLLVLLEVGESPGLEQRIHRVEQDHSGPVWQRVVCLRGQRRSL